MNQFNRCQAEYDNRLPPEYWEDDYQDAQRKCEYCDEPLYQKKDETNGNWIRREHCDKKCSSLHRESKKRKEY